MKDIVILTERTRLRLVDMSDIDVIHTLHSLPETDEFNTLGIPESIDETRLIITTWVTDNKLVAKTNYTFAIEDKLNNSFLGLFGLKLSNNKYKRGEIWYKFHSDHWNKGFATEVLVAMIDFGFNTLNLHRIQAGCAVGNIGSIKVLEKAGMIKEGRGRQVLPLSSGWSDNFEYAILENDKRN